jgi:N-methylhydantoinase A
LSLGVTIPQLENQGLAVLTDEFDRQHEQLFTFAHGKDHEIVMIRAIVKAKSSLKADLKEVSDKQTALEDAKFHDTQFYYEEEWHDAVIYDRGKLGIGTVIPGPAIVVEMDSTTLVLPHHAATVDQVGNLLINPV